MNVASQTSTNLNEYYVKAKFNYKHICTASNVPSQKYLSTNRKLLLSFSNNNKRNK
jgi:hypothetical protein